MRAPVAGAEAEVEVERRSDMTDVTHAGLGVEADAQMGPVDFLVVEFPGDRRTGEGLPALVDLVDQGIIRIIDLVFVKRGDDGSLVQVMVADIDGDGALDLAVFEGAATGIIGDEEMSEAADVLAPGSSAAILVYENTWAVPFVTAMARSGAQVVATGRIPVEALAAALGAD
jgi:hypothetical protein